VARADAPTPAPAPSGGDQVRVASGDSLSRIASRNALPGVSLDQMLVSLFRGNPQAFVADNMNRLKAGSVLTLPSADQARQVGAAEAREVIQAQSADFAAYRQRLASGTTTVADQAPSRQARGQVQANVDDQRQAAAASPDKLTLSQGAVKAAPEAAVSKATESQAAQARLAELSRNVEDLKRLQQGTAALPAAAAPTAPAPAAAPAPAPAIAPSPSPAPAPAVAAAPPPTATAPAAPPAPNPAPPAPVVATAPAPAPAPPSPGFFDSMLENPLLLPGAGVLVALLAGLGIYRLRARSRKEAGETSFLESRLQPDSFFGASGGQRIDTREATAGTPSSTASSSSMSYSLSQLDAIGDVDPVAEADVYLAYGRDLQAEEILKEAMRGNPDRMAIRTKLLEVYAKRRDPKGFELLATQVFSMTGGTGDDWAKAQEMGRQIDPDNVLYEPGGKPDLAVDDAGRVIEPLDATTMPHTAKKSPPGFVPAADATLSGPVEVDLDLDMPALDTGFGSAAPTRPMTPGATLDGGDSLSFDLPPVPTQRPAAPNDVELPTSPGALEIRRPAQDSTLDFDLGDLPLSPPPQEAPSARTRSAAPDSGFDAGLDFGDTAGGDVGPSSTLEDGDPLARKLELAEEFRQIGDIEGARDLLEEVVAKAEGTLKHKAQGMLDGLS
jgi:pilus assembly protein FimV